MRCQPLRRALSVFKSFEVKLADNWKDYQEEAAEFFRSMGLDAKTDQRVNGVRTHHDIDVLVTSHHAGFDITWVVECKYWQKPVSKLHVLALREIVSDVGADRGILLSESGYQSGAIEAAKLTNVQVTSLADLNISASSDILSMRIRELYDRKEVCKERYWDIPKELRQDHGLRPEIGDSDTAYSGSQVLDYCERIFIKAFRGIFPFESREFVNFYISDVPNEYTSISQVYNVLDHLVSDLEARLDKFDSEVEYT
ncbi:restriction endonuclease [Vibrio cholerae]|nr:restriction endonuclease [Vibrio cholerae]EJL7978810.1 restriction endonuclease [Vibrio cholerae]HDG1522451.1 restriction endonuclease [Vibrio cholerae]HDG1526150.1 restriction endonuclease [Vibrio cholerae]